MITHNTVKIRKVKISLASGKNYCFNDSNILISSQEFDIFAKALDIILGGQGRRSLNDGDQILAQVDLARPYLVFATKTSFEVKDVEGNDRTAQYVKLLVESEESHFIRHFEHYKREEYPHKLKDYRTLENE